MTRLTRSRPALHDLATLPVQGGDFIATGQSEKTCPFAENTSPRGWMPTETTPTGLIVAPSTSNSESVPDQRLLTAACRPSGEQATATGFRPHGSSANTLPAGRSTSDTESAVWLAASASRPPGSNTTSTGLRWG